MLRNIFALLTGPREKITPQWSNKSYTHNIFRLWEVVFGRKWGVCPETSAVFTKTKSYYYFHTWEAALGHFEGWVRNSFRLRPFRIYIPVLITPSGIPVPVSPYLFAIAWDASLASGSASGSFTCTGSNRALTAWTHAITGDLVTSWTYNLVALTLQDKANSAGNNFAYSYLLINPASGSNTWVETGGATNNCLNSFSGAKQTGQPDAHGSTTGSSTSPSRAITTVASNCIVVGALSYDNSSAVTSPSNFSNPADNSGNSASLYTGNSATQASPGSVTQSATLGSSTTWAVLQISLSPTVAATNSNFLAFM